MATAQVLHPASDTDCSVCHEPFKEPKVLPCGHVVCRHCLVSWLRAQPKADCPLCRCAVLEREGQPGKLEEEVGALPTDLALAELVEARALLDKDHTCVCDDVAATALCLHCRDMLCASCAKVHGKMTVTKHHKVQDLSTLTPEALADSRLPACSSHPDKECTLYCATHGLSLCVLCVAAKLRCCPDLRDVEERTEEARAALEKMAASLSASETELKDAIQRRLDRHILDTGERVQAAFTDIKKTCDRLEAAVKSCRGRMADLARDAAAHIEDKTRAAIVTLQGRKSRITMHTAVVKRAKGSTAPGTINDMHSLMQTRVPTLDCSVTLPASAEVCSTLTFVIDEQAVRGVERALEELGRVHLVPADHSAIFSHTGEFVFHTNHGLNIVLSNNNLTATRKVGNGNSIVLSRDPMVEDVMYEVRLDQWQRGWGMRVGVLPERPDRVTLPQRARQLRPASLVCHEGVKLSGADGWVLQPDHPAASAMKGLRQGQRVGVSLDASRQVHLHVDGKDRGVWDTVDNATIYVIIDLLGYKGQVTALPPTALGS